MKGKPRPSRCPGRYRETFAADWTALDWPALRTRYPRPDGQPYSDRAYRYWATELGLASRTAAARAESTPSPALADATPAPPPLTPQEAVDAAIAQEQERLDGLAARQEERKLLREAAHWSRVIQVLREEVPRLPPAVARPYPAPQASTEVEEDIVLLVSDSQIGELVERDFTAGLGQYDRGMFIERAERYYRAVSQLIRMHQQMAPVRQLHFIMAGDIIEGCTIYKSQAFALDRLHSVAQVRLGIEVFSDILAQLSAELGLPIRVGSVPGNHGRIGGKGETPYMNSLDQMVAYGMRYRLEQHPRITWSISDSPRLFRRIQGRLWAVEHGDVVKGTLSIPMYGLLRHHGRLTTLAREPVDVVLIGHHHTPSYAESGFGARVIIGGSWVGASDLSYHVLGMGGLPSQWMFGVNRPHGIAWQREVYLSTLEELHRLQVDDCDATAAS